MTTLALPGLLAAALLCACTSVPLSMPAPPASPPPAPPPAAASERLPHYRCEHGIEFTVRSGEDAVLLDAGPRGRELLLRDAGGLTPQQTVYSSPRLRAEFGLGAAGNEAVLHYPAPPLVARCVRD